MEFDPETAVCALSVSRMRILRSEFACDEVQALIDRTLEITQSTRRLILKSDRAIERFQTLGRGAARMV